MVYLNQPILFDFPDHFETKRMILRAPRPGDGRMINDALSESLENLRPWMSWAQQPPTVEKTEASTRYAANRFRERRELRFLLFRKTDKRFIGVCGLQNIDWAIPRFEIGYWVRTSMEGQGYITEAVRGVTQFAFEVLGARRIELRCDPRNTRSVAVARRTGYTLDACLHNDRRDVNGEMADTLLFSRTLPD
jgi:RimJ/RimL family protein N-acetyltransferase